MKRYTFRWICFRRRMMRLAFSLWLDRRKWRMIEIECRHHKSISNYEIIEMFFFCLFASFFLLTRPNLHPFCLKNESLSFECFQTNYRFWVRIAFVPIFFFALLLFFQCLSDSLSVTNFFLFQSFHAIIKIYMSDIVLTSFCLNLKRNSWFVS